MNINILLTVRYSYQSYQRGAGNISALSTIKPSVSTRNELKTVKHQTVISTDWHKLYLYHVKFILYRIDTILVLTYYSVQLTIMYTVYSHSLIIIIQKLRKAARRGEGVERDINQLSILQDSS